MAQKQRWKAKVIGTASLIPIHRLENRDRWNEVALRLFIFFKIQGLQRIRGLI